MSEGTSTVPCPYCDFSSGQRGMDTCGKCDGTGRISTIRLLMEERDAALARAEKAEADLRNEQRVVAGFKVLLGDAKAERDALLTRFDTAAWKTDCDDCAFRKEGQQYCGFKNCSEAATEWAAQEAAKRGEVE